MDDDQFDDLKQFIAATVSQSEARLKEDLASKDDLKLLSQKIDAGFAGVGEAIDDLGTDLDRRFAEHTVRLDDHAQHLGLLKAA